MVAISIMIDSFMRSFSLRTKKLLMTGNQAKH
jgi:hypothetical protein